MPKQESMLQVENKELIKLLQSIEKYEGWKNVTEIREKIHAVLRKWGHLK